MPKTLYVEPVTSASKAAAAYTSAGDLSKAARMRRIADHAQSIWLGDWTSDPTKSTDTLVTAAMAKAQVPVLVLYNIPGRDGDAYSSGGAKDTTSYWRFVAQVARGLRNREAIVILEPDATALVDFLDPVALDKRLAILSCAVDTLTAAGAKVYIDAGSYNWIPAATIAPRLLAAGIAHAAGFSLNVSDSEYTNNEVAFARQIQGQLKGLGLVPHFIIDVSRNGSGPPIGATGEDQWCNPPSLRLGQNPTLETAIDGCDGLLWIKRPGESDGLCNGGPAAGKWWLDGALRLTSS